MLKLCRTIMMLRYVRQPARVSVRACVRARACQWARERMNSRYLINLTREGENVNAIMGGGKVEVSSIFENSF